MVKLAKPKARKRRTGDPGEERYKVRFPDQDSFFAGQAIESPGLDVKVVNEKRTFLSLGLSESTDVPGERFAATPSDLEGELTTLEREYGAEIVVDYRYALEEGEPDDFDLPVLPELPAGESLDDVLNLIEAREAWEVTRGAGVTVAIVDTGIDGNRPEFGSPRRRGQWAPQGEDPWSDYKGHGTMCACIATASRADGGEFDGVAPEAGLISCRTKFYDSELASIYDYLIGLVETDSQLRLVISNSFGVRTGTPPPDDPDSDFLPALGEALDAGIAVCFSAGNYHELVRGEPTACGPTSIWGYKCRGDVITVAASRPDGTMWSYSSRGPGQHAGQPEMSDKPDLTAPTPPDGRVLYGGAPRTLPQGWGTSGACPQVAGLLALLMSVGHDREEAVKSMRQAAHPSPREGTAKGTGSSLVGPL